MILLYCLICKSFNHEKHAFLCHLSDVVGLCVAKNSKKFKNNKRSDAEDLKVKKKLCKQELREVRRLIWGS